MDHAKISPDQLEDALVHQKYFSGKAGTHLVELGFLSLPDLEKALADYFMVPSASDAQLEGLDDYSRTQVPVEMIERFQVLPFRFSQQTLSVAMVNPEDEKAIIFLKKLLQCELRIYSLSEIRFQYFLFRHHHREWKAGDPRIRNLFILHRKRRAHSMLTTGKPTVEPPTLEDLGIKPLAHGEELLQESDFSWLQMPDPKPTSEFEPEFAVLE